MSGIIEKDTETTEQNKENSSEENTGTDTQENNKNGFQKFLSNPKAYITDVLIGAATLFGIGAVIIAPFMPSIIENEYKHNVDKYNYIGDLGTVGDFLGGTTVAILTAASVFLLLATIIMQRREIKISQQGIVELVKQTEASIQQAEEARKETIVTNETMKRQQFESTFFNMISLHSNLVRNIDYYGIKEHSGIKQSLDFVRGKAVALAGKRFPQLFNETHDYEKVEELIKQLKSYNLEATRQVDFDNKEEVINTYKNLRFEDLLIVYKIDNPIIQAYGKYTRNITDENLIEQSFEEFIQENESLVLRHFNSFVLIINFLRNSQFEKEDNELGTESNKIYREIFFSQLSLEEMVLIFYLARYTSLNDWLLDELRTYNAFYPSIIKSLLLFQKTDIENIKALSS